MTADGLPAHGTRRRYQLGCRCGVCVEANTVYQRLVRAGVRGTPGARLVGFELGRP